MWTKKCEQKQLSQKESLSFSVLDAYIILTSGSTKKYYLVMVIKLIQKIPTIRLIFFFFFLKPVWVYICQSMNNQSFFSE